MQKKDLFNHIRNFESWENSLTPEYIEEGMTKANSKLFVEYMLFLGKRHSKGYAYRNLTKIRSIFKGLQISGVNDISKIKEKQVNDYFEEWCKTHSIDYVRRFVAFWNWNRKENRKKGIVIQEIEINALDFNQNSKESIFVWFSKEEFDKIRTYFDEDKQTILLFIFDSIIRAPTELAS